MSRIAAITYAQADKLIIGSMIGVKELAYYTVAATLSNRVLGLMYRVSAVLFPAASTLAAKGHWTQLEDLYIKSSRYVGFLNASILTLLAAFAEPLLRLWMGADFAFHGTLVLQLIAVAQFVDSLTNLPSLVNDGMGHPRVSGLFALTRAILGLALLFIGVSAMEIRGAAWAHLIAASLMTVLFLLYVHGRTVPCRLSRLISESYMTPLGIVGIIAVVTFCAVQIFAGQPLFLFITMTLAGAVLCWTGFNFILLEDEQNAIRDRIARIRSRH